MSCMVANLTGAATPGAAQRKGTRRFIDLYTIGMCMCWRSHDVVSVRISTLSIQVVDRVLAVSLEISTLALAV